MSTSPNAISSGLADYTGVPFEGVIYPNRTEAGRALAARLHRRRTWNPLVLGLPRGGVPVAHAVSADIGGDLDILLVRKLGLPAHPELAMGAIGEDGCRILNDDVLCAYSVSTTELAAVERRERAELDRRAAVLRGDRPAIPIRGRTVVIVDDGMATGATAAVACRVAADRGAGRVVLAVPIATDSAVRRLAEYTDELICAQVPSRFDGVGQAYLDFHQLADDEVTILLGQPRGTAYAANDTDE